MDRRCPCKLSDLEWFCKENWANIATSRCATLLGSYPRMGKNSRLCNDVVKCGKHALSQFLLDVLQPWNSKLIIIWQKTKRLSVWTLYMLSLKYIQLNIGWKGFSNHCILFLFTFYQFPNSHRIRLVYSFTSVNMLLMIGCLYMFIFLYFS